MGDELSAQPALLVREGAVVGARAAPDGDDPGGVSGQNLEDEEIDGGDDEDGQEDVDELLQEIPAKVRSLTPCGCHHPILAAGYVFGGSWILPSSSSFFFLRRIKTTVATPTAAITTTAAIPMYNVVRSVVVPGSGSSLIASGVA